MKLELSVLYFSLDKRGVGKKKNKETECPRFVKLKSPAIIIQSDNILNIPKF